MVLKKFYTVTLYRFLSVRGDKICHLHHMNQMFVDLFPTFDSLSTSKGLSCISSQCFVRNLVCFSFTKACTVMMGGASQISCSGSYSSEKSSLRLCLVELQGHFEWSHTWNVGEYLLQMISQLNWDIANSHCDQGFYITPVWVQLSQHFTVKESSTICCPRSSELIITTCLKAWRVFFLFIFPNVARMQ